MARVRCEQGKHADAARVAHDTEGQVCNNNNTKVSIKPPDTDTAAAAAAVRPRNHCSQFPFKYNLRFFCINNDCNPPPPALSRTHPKQLVAANQRRVPRRPLAAAAAWLPRLEHQLLAPPLLQVRIADSRSRGGGKVGGA